MKYSAQNTHAKINTSDTVWLPETTAATSTPAGTPSAVPTKRAQPLVRVSFQVLVPAKITNAAITAQYQRDGETSSPITIASDAATATWMACLVVGNRPARGSCSSGSDDAAV